MSLCCDEQTIGADPLFFNWQVVRGDTSTLDFQFLEDDEVTFIDISDWTFVATAYNPVDEESYILDVVKSDGIVQVTANADVTAQWGIGIKPQTAELKFDLEGTSGEIVWTPVIGTIKVLGDVTIGGL
jgi:hypothetical protein